MQKLDINLVSSYDYSLPSELIASYPANPRQSARLLVYKRDTKEIIHSNFSELFFFLPPDISVILNNTKVIKARIFGKKISGGGVELLLNSPQPNNLFKVYIKGKVKENTILLFDENLVATVVKMHEDGSREVRFTQNEKEVDVLRLYEILEKIGHIPLPPYIKREDETLDAKEYQSVFALHSGAVAAPTASLHFDDEMFNLLQKRYNTAYLTLHIGAGTFKGVEVDDINDHLMHSEYFEIPKDAQEIIDSDKKILCVGTTSARSVEYYKRTDKTQGYCDLFLNPNNSPLRVDHLLTNFHLPKSTLIMLVASFIGIDETLRIYNSALKERYRFFSYGDAMLII